MSVPIHLERRWLMDTFGNFLQYSPMSQELVSTAFTPQSFPNLFTFIPIPEKFPHRAILRLTHSIPSSIPPSRFIRINAHEVAIQNIETDRYLCSHMHLPTASWHAEMINDWEHFMLLNKEMMTGISILSDPDISICYMNSEKISNLIFTGTANIAMIGDIEIKISDNLNEISKLANAPVHQPIKLSLTLYEAKEEKINIEVIPQRSL